MFCINCLHNDTKVVNSRAHKKSAAVWRRRKCPACGYVFSTNETPLLQFRVTSKGRAQPYLPAKVASSVFASLLTAGLEPSQGYWLVETIEQHLTLVAARQQQKLTSQEIYQTIYRVVSAYDPAAGLAYAARHQQTTAPPKRRPKLS
jgi:transcriptional regulator NrdR family protein